MPEPCYPRARKRRRARSLDGGDILRASMQPRVSRRRAQRRGAAPVLALVLLVPVIALAAGVLAIIASPPFFGIDLGVRRISERLEEEGATFHRLPRPPERSIIYASDGETVLATVYLDENREIVTLRQVSPIARRAVLAIEDRNFFEHSGVDPQSVARAFLANLFSGEIVQGGSTITQQLVKNTLIDTPSQTYARKLQEAGLALRMEERYTKKEILELYLNEVYLGHGVYGIGTAAQFYFDRPASKLTLPQAAILAGMIAAPETYDPVDRPNASRRRRNEVLREMAEVGWAAAGEVDRIRRDPVEIPRGAGEVHTEVLPQFVRYLRDQILENESGEYEEFGKTYKQRLHTLFQGGLEITTTLEPGWQEHAERVAQDHLPDARGTPDTSIVTVETHSGAIRTMLSGKNFERDKQRLALSPRQPGSAFKPFTLVAAFREHIQPSTTYPSRSPLRLRGWDSESGTVSNAEGASNRGELDLWEATAGSVNVVFAQLALDVGPENIVDAAHDMGITSPLDAVPSITLGAEEASPLDMASAFQTLANEGVHCEPFAVVRVVDEDGVLYHHRPHCERAIEADIANLVTAMLIRVVEGGTGTAAAIGRPVAGKTGTTQESTDVWFVGYTRELSTAVWVGLPGNPASMEQFFSESVYGGTIAAPIWHDYMLRAVSGSPAGGFPDPPRPERGRVPDVVGMDVGQARSVLEREDFRVDVEPVDSTQREGRVVGQSPSGGSTADLGTSVRLEVSTGKPPTKRVPGVVGLRVDEARALIRAKGLFAAVSFHDVTQKDKIGIVIAQSPGEGANAEPGSTVRLTVGKRK
jgi:penicillin-binding protein 1A